MATADEQEARLGRGGFPDPFAVLRALSAGRYVIVIVAAVIVGLTALYALSAKSVYTASTKILIEPYNRQPFDSASAPSRIGVDAFAVDSQIAVISSASVLRPVVEGHKLVDDPEFGTAKGAGLLGLLFGAILPEAKETPADEAARINKTMIALGKALSVARQGSTYVVDIAVSSESPSKAATLSQAIANSYLNEQQRSFREQAERLAEQIDDRLVGLRERVREAEEKVQEFRAKNRLQSSAADGTLLIGQELEGLNAQLVEARSALASADAANQEIQRYLKREVDPTALGDLVTSPRITQLLQEYAAAVRSEASLAAELLPSHPTMIRARAQVERVGGLIREEIRGIGEAKRIERDVARERVANIERQIETLRTSANTDEAQLITLRELETEARATRAVYESVLSRAKEVANLEQVTAPVARIISPAEPPINPSWPKRKVLLVLAGILGLMLGTALVVARELLRQIRMAVFSGRADKARPVIAADTHTRKKSALPLIGALPALDGLAGEDGGSRDFASSARLVYRMLAGGDASGLPAPAPGYEKAVQGLLAGLLRERRGGGSQVVLMVAGERGDGLSLAAFSVGVAAAARGLKVLLVDANARDKDLTRLLDSEGGLGRVGISERIVENRHFDLSFLSLVAGAPKHRPLALEGDERSDLEEIAEGYDLVLVDAGLVGDAGGVEGLAGLGSMILLTLRSDADTDERTAEERPALQRIAGGRPVFLATTDA
ncbi:hypothetical protein H2509_02195 [Stappia sp. F7233]|uniref:Polysaccharide chain length determinant N-terminal domain-containing protein n=1 Tax=Stappia albiluteola TaxID=2758565 RepID=A0A839A8T3_9HYPH|nr:exopolysaccharide transport family protein [Stappia albiluteola]MBA5775933.1 hypothetical protein [Stappia albiluteola]